MGDDQLVGAGSGTELLEILADLRRRTDGRNLEHLVDVIGESCGQQLIGFLSLKSKSLDETPRDRANRPIARNRRIACCCSCAAAVVSAATTFTPAITYGDANCSDGRNSAR